MYNANLDVFLTVCRTGNVSKAAEKLFVTQPVVTRKIKQLERRFGVCLFTRTSQGVTPTEAGKILEEAALSMKSLSDTTLARMQATERGSEDIVRVGASLNLYWSQYPAARALFRKRYPTLDTESVYFEDEGRHWTSLAEALETRDIDLAISALNQRFDREDFDIVKLEPTQRLCLLSPAHPLAARDELHPNDILDYPLCLPDTEGNTSYELLRELARATNRESNIENQWIPVQEVEASETIYVVLDCSREQFPTLRAIPYEDGLPQTILGAVCRRDASPATKLFVQTITELAAEEDRTEIP